MPKQTRINRSIFTILLIAVFLAPGCTTLGQTATKTDTPQNTPVPQATEGAPVVTAPTTNSALAALQGTLEDIYRQVSPSVVNIQVTQKESVDTAGIPDFPTIPGFPAPQIPQPSPGEPRDFYSRGSGSGFVWDKEGHIITNNHVTEGADKIMVIFADETTVPGQLIGADPDSDLAVIKVDVPAAQLQPVQLADSTKLQIGQLAVAIGNPFGLEGTMTVGFVSALGRLLPVEGNQTGPRYNIPDVIQTDAPINPGNSGGVLVEETGRVIGVTSAIISPVQASAGIGFAIPSAVVEKVVPALIANGRYEHSYLGVSIVSLTPDLNQEMDLPAEQQGALVVDVVPDSPSEAAQLHGSDRQVTIDGQDYRVGGDVITAVDGEPVRSSDDLITYLARYTEVGQTITLTVLRNGKEESVDVTLAARPTAETAESQPQKAESGNGRLGIVGLSVTPPVAEAMDLPASQTGVLIEQIERGSAADMANLRGSYKPATVDGRQILVGGDIIVAFDDRPVETLADLQNALQQANPGDSVSLRILRDGEQMEVAVTLAES